MHEKNAQLKESIDLNECSYINWHKTFDKITPRSICVPLPSDILDYLLDEMIILPKECYEKQQNTVEASTSSKTFDSSDDGNDDPEVSRKSRSNSLSFPIRLFFFFYSQNFPSLAQKLTTALNDLAVLHSSKRIGIARRMHFG